MEHGPGPPVTSVSPWPAELPAMTAILDQAGDENFPVASRLLPASVRPHLLAVYGFARLADEIGDEADGDRLALLDWLDDELERATAGRATHPIMRRLTVTMRAGALPPEPFRRLIDANRQDQAVHRYATFGELAEYCRRSATPVGELVLRIVGAATPERLTWSDDVCTGLQLVEHLQDIGEDARAGRIYLPADEMARFGCAEAALLAASADESLRALVLFEADRAERLLRAGVPLARSLHGRVRLGVAAFAAGGLAAVDAIRAAGGDTLAVSCRPRRRRVAYRWAQVLTRRPPRAG